MTAIAPTIQCPCDGRHRQETFVYEAAPSGETRFDLPGDYRRAYDRCGLCGHWFGRHNIDLSALYGGAYVDSSYGDADGMRRTFERIIAFPPERSDNHWRAERVNEFGRAHLGAPAPAAPTLLDVGAGLSVFPHAMKVRGWDVTALDPDPRAARHAEVTVGVKAVAGDFFAVETPSLGHFDAISFNKVLEHVEDPVAMLVRAKSLLKPNGFLYIELPDGEGAAAEGKGREEFFIEHHHVFSLSSMILTGERAGLRTLEARAIREPSTKYTVYGFMTAA